MNPLTKVAALMATDLITITVHTPLHKAKELFDKYGIHHLPVVGPAGELKGLLSHSDFLKLVGRESGQLTAGDMMISKLAKLTADDNVRTAANVFRLNKFHALPVVEGEKLIGIITTHDLIRLIDDEEVELKDYSK